MSEKTNNRIQCIHKWARYHKSADQKDRLLFNEVLSILNTALKPTIFNIIKSFCLIFSHGVTATLSHMFLNHQHSSSHPHCHKMLNCVTRTGKNTPLKVSHAYNFAGRSHVESCRHGNNDKLLVVILLYGSTVRVIHQYCVYPLVNAFKEGNRPQKPHFKWLIIHLTRASANFTIKQWVSHDRGRRLQGVNS